MPIDASLPIQLAHEGVKYALCSLRVLYPLLASEGEERDYCVGNGGCHTLRTVAERYTRIASYEAL